MMQVIEQTHDETVADEDEPPCCACVCQFEENIPTPTSVCEAHSEWLDAALAASSSDVLALLKQLEWASCNATTDEPRCPCCSRLQARGHMTNCRLAKVIGS